MGAALAGVAEIRVHCGSSLEAWGARDERFQKKRLLK